MIFIDFTYMLPIKSKYTKAINIVKYLSSFQQTYHVLFIEELELTRYNW